MSQRFLFWSKFTKLYKPGQLGLSSFIHFKVVFTNTSLTNFLCYGNSEIVRVGFICTQLLNILKGPNCIGMRLKKNLQGLFQFSIRLEVIKVQRLVLFYFQGVKSPPPRLLEYTQIYWIFANRIYSTWFSVKEYIKKKTLRE